MDAIGRNSQQTREEGDEVLNQEENDDSSVNAGSNSGLNASLGNICSALDTSYVSRKARSLNKKKVEKKIQEAEKKRARE